MRAPSVATRPSLVRRLVRVALAALAIGAPPLAAQPTQPARADARARVLRVADSLAAAVLRDVPVAGLSIAVVKGRDTLVMKGYGFADLENDLPVTPATVFRIGSVTKQFTAAAVMQLVEQGKVGLDDDITKYFPTFPSKGKPILIRHLLNHTSGIPSYTDLPPSPARNALMSMGVPHDTLIGFVRDLPLMFEPGGGFYYNNTGYFMLGMLLEQVTGRPYGDYLAERLFTPLGLSGTTYCETRPLIKHRAQGYDRERGRLVNTEYIAMSMPYAAGSLCSTARDLVAWTAALAGGRVVSAASYAQMTTPARVPGPRRMTYGFALTSDTLGAHRTIQHGGNVNGFSAQLSYFPAETLTVAVLANTSGAPVGPLAENIARAAFGMPFRTGPEQPADVPVAPAERQRYVGSYLVTQPDGSTRPVRVVEANGQLALEGMTPQPLRLMRQSGDVFAIAGQPAARLYFIVEGGATTGLIIDRGARPLPGRRSGAP